MSIQASAPPFITRVKIRNYKSIAACDLELSRFQFLVGPNGTGKSNFLDAIHFVSEALDTTLEHALHRRGGINEVRRRSRGHPTHFSIQLNFNTTAGHVGHYAFRIGSAKEGLFEVQYEKFSFLGQNGLGGHHFTVDNGRVVESSLDVLPPYSKDRLYLFAVSGFEAIRPVYDALVRMEFFNLNPGVIRELQPADAGEKLKQDGRNLANIYGRLPKASRDRVVQYLASLVPGISEVRHEQIAGNETLRFYQAVRGDKNNWKFYARSMSDGTLRALALLVAILQERKEAKNPSLIGIEEPEIALHPAGAAILMDALLEASSQRQILATSHSPDILDSELLTADNLIAVESIEGVTHLGPIDEVGREALRRRLFTPGELLRLNQLAPERTVSPDANESQLGMFKF